ncbi:MAG: ADP-ribosylglycohydrolase family protein [Christensenellales bacterium]|jgi:ADP-ribosylglycohydrolase
MRYFNRAELRDRIHACWIGKNIGGTMGAPYEGRRELLDVQGYASPPGKALPNDDLDLQLIWLKAVDELGPQGVDAQALGEYWLSYIGPNWNEYGVGKSNLREGLAPPLSGEMNNDQWKHSNGAWIRTEIWACLHPGLPERAIRFAYEDACVDHGYGEGTWAAIFVAALESAAFVLQQVDALLDVALSKIPEGCRVARSVKLVRSAWAEGVDWKTCRERLVEDSADLGWFQAPANVAFVVLGLLYGQGDFKRSMLLALNCGDDTDCTGATLGALMGILQGSAGIPEDWRAYIGDEIVTMCILKGHGHYPASCQELTDCVMDLLPVTCRTPLAQRLLGGEAELTVGDGPTDLGVAARDLMGDDFARELASRPPYSLAAHNALLRAVVSFDGPPVIAPGGSLSGRVCVSLGRMPEQQHLRLTWHLPEGWSAAGRANLHASALGSPYTEHASAPFTLTAGDRVAPNNALVLSVSCVGRSLPLLIPITILG